MEVITIRNLQKMNPIKYHISLDYGLSYNTFKGVSPWPKTYAYVTN